MMPTITRTRPRGTTAHKLLTLALSTMIVLCLVSVAELYCRRNLKVHFLGNSRNLFVANRFGSSRGNLTNGAAVSFGVTVNTDENGFRIDPHFKDPAGCNAVLILGDSVGFACGVEEPQSTVGRLRCTLTNTRFYNSSSIGYCLKDYEAVVHHWLPKHRDVKAVYVLMCLNDIYDDSASQIRENLEQARASVPTNVVVMAKRFTVLQGINDWTRSHLKLVNVAKSIVSDNAKRIFLFDLEVYKHSQSFFNTNMDALRRIDESCQKSHLAFKVIVLPYEVQLRSRDAALLLPQAMIIQYLQQNHVAVLDTTELFRESGFPMKALYLFDDAMHLSPLGHQLLARLLMDDIRVTIPSSFVMR
jgi:hypothetical protein